MPVRRSGTNAGRRLRNGFSFGGALAESDPLLDRAYFDNGDFSRMVSYEDPHRFLIGRTGSGKSAAFHHLQQTHPEKVIRLAPEDLSLPYLTNLNIVHHLLELNVRLDPFFTALWKHVIIVEVIKHRYQVTN